MSAHRQENALTFKAGRMYRDGETNWVRPDLRKGECQLTFIGSGAVRLRWTQDQNTSGSGEEPARPAQEEFVFFSGDAVAEKVTQSTGRVYVIRSKSTSTRLFFWLQSSDADMDDQIEDAINAVLLDDADRITDDSEDEDDDEELREALALSRRTGEQLAVVRETPDLRASMLPTARVGGNRGGNDVVVPPGSGGMEQLRQILSSFQVPEVTRGGKSRLAVQLGDVLTPEHLAPVLADPEVRRALLPTLPENIPRTTARDLENIVRSPQFQQALAALSYLLEDGQIAAVVSQLGLDPQASTSVAAFLEAVGRQVAQEKSKDQDDDDATMQE